MYEIPLIDIRKSDPTQLVFDHAEKTRNLVNGSRKTLGLLSEVLSYVLLPSGDQVSRDWLSVNNNPYLPEITTTADHLDVPGIYMLNICFEWGCTSAVFAKEDGAHLVRVLDWIFPKLGENIVVAHQNGNAGDFYNITWPGVSGMFHGMAPGRFSASLNQAPMQKHNLTYVGDWYKNRRRVFNTSYLPPAHLLRQVFEEAKSFEDAKNLLCKTPVAIPVIYILAGLEKDEGCVIERTETCFYLRGMEKDRVCAANHFETELKDIGPGWRPRPVDSQGRAQQARNLSIELINDEFNWFKAPLANSHTRLALIASAKSGKLSVLGTNGAKPVTKVFKHLA